MNQHFLLKLKRKVIRTQVLMYPVLFILFCSGNVPSEMKKMMELLKQKKYLTHVSIELFDNPKTTKPVEKDEMSVVVWGNEIHYKSALVETFSTKACKISIDHQQRIILLNKPEKEIKRALFQRLEPINFDSLLSGLYSIEVDAKTDHITRFRISYQLESSPIEYVLYSIDNRYFKPISIEIYYSKSLSQLMGSVFKKKSGDKARMSIHYDRFEFLDKYPSKYFDYGSIIQIPGKGFPTLGSNYKGYELFNYLTSTKNSKR